MTFTSGFSMVTVIAPSFDSVFFTCVPQKIRPPARTNDLGHRREIREWMEARLIGKAETRSRVEGCERRAIELLHDDAREARSVVLVVEDVLRVALGQKQIAVEASEVAVDVVVAHERFDEVDRGRVRARGDARALLAVHARDLDVAIVDLVREVRGGARRLAAADLPVVDDDDFLSLRARGDTRW